MPTASKQTSPLWEVLFPSEGDPTLATYCIIDGAACDELLPQLDQHQPDHCCLYAGDLDDDVAEVAPYLIYLEFDHPFTVWLLESMGTKPWGIFCKAPSTLREMRKHFRKFLIVKGPEGENLYFRFYDPRVLTVFLPTCDTEQVTEIFGPVFNYFAANGEVSFAELEQQAGKLARRLHSIGCDLEESKATSRRRGIARNGMEAESRNRPTNGT